MIKKKWMLIPAIAGVIAVGSVAMAEDAVPSNSKQAKNLITLEEAKQIAVEKVKNGKVTEIGLDKEDGYYHFDVDLKDEMYEYDLEVDAYTGEIIKFEKEEMKNSKHAKSGKKMTEEKATAIVKKKAVGTIKEFKLDTIDGHIYDIKMKDSKFDYEIEIDAETGRYLKFEKERYGSVKHEVNEQNGKVADSSLKVVEQGKEQQTMKSDNNKKLDKRSMLTKEQAIAIAKQYASGVVTEFELDDHIYEIEMEDGDIEYEIEIHAYTGDLLSFERDED